VVHGLRGKASSRRVAKRLRERAVKLYRSQYGDLGPTLAAEYWAEKHGIAVSKETLRKWLLEEGVWKARRRRVKPVHAWRPRRSCRGELVQWDTSIHDWLEGRSREPLKLIAMIDDATNELWARFVREDSTREHRKVLREYLERNGRPLAFYTDKAGLYLANARRIGYREEKTEEGETQIGRALRELGIELIHAHSPRAKGRVERCFGTLQERLVKGLRKAGAQTLSAAHEYRDKTFLPPWRRRFCGEPASRPRARDSTAWECRGSSSWCVPTPGIARAGTGLSGRAPRTRSRSRCSAQAGSRTNTPAARRTARRRRCRPR
jgi:transposase-like protein